MLSTGHQQRGHRLTDQDVRFDAARILEELLETRIDEDVKGHHKVRRLKTDYNVRKSSSHINGGENIITRSKTLPSDYRESVDKQIKQKELETLVEEPSHNQKSHNVDLDGSGSSADTEDNLSISEKRKKKSLIKRAKERLIFRFHRSKKSQPGTLKETSDLDTANSDKQKSKKTGKSKRESEDHLKTLAREDKPVDNQEELGSKDKNGTVHTKVHSVQKSKGNLLSSFRKSKKPVQITSGSAYTQRDSNGRAHQEINSNGGGKHAARENPSSSLQELGIQRGMPSPQKSVEDQGHVFSSGMQNDSKHPGQLPGHPAADSSRSSTNEAPSSLSSTSSPSHKSLQLASRKIAAIISGETLAFSDSIVPPGHFSTELTSYTPSSIQSSVLDNPGDDIEFMDASDSESKSKCGNEGSRSRFHATVFQLNVNNDRLLPPDQAPGIAQLTGVQDSTHQPDGSHRTVAARQAVPAGQEEVLYDELDGPLDELPNEPQNVNPNREALYSVIAQKLIEMGDSYSASMSDNQPRPQAAEAQKPLTSLEMEIINCLRSTGDRVSAPIPPAIYQRFRSTVQNSLGSELSWNHVAFLYHTARIVTSAVGKGTRAARLVKDFTLQYVSETCATWIIDQGGFDILLSSDDSDFGVD